MFSSLHSLYLEKTCQLPLLLLPFYTFQFFLLNSHFSIFDSFFVFYFFFNNFILDTIFILLPNIIEIKKRINELEEKLFEIVSKKRMKEKRGEKIEKEKILV